MTRKIPITMAVILIAFHVLSPAPAVADASSLLPGPGTVEGWDPDGEMLSYGPDDLWEYINGSAETFLMYDFRGVVAMHYLDGSENEVKVEIYQHGSPLMTFGIYSQFRSPDAEFFDIGAEAFGDEYAIHFWKGDFYVKIDSYSEGEQMRSVMETFARAVEGAIGEGGKEPLEISLFPAEGLLRSSIVYMTEGVMGSGKLPPAFVAPYILGEEKGKVYLFPLGDEEKAGQLHGEYTESIGASAEKKELAGIECLFAAGEAPYRGRVLAVQKDRWMAVVTGFGDTPESADGLAGGILKKLAEASGR